MKYFNGFCLRGEEELFTSYHDKGSYTIVGFSYGAIKAFEYCLNTKKRVDKLILLSPAFFQENSTSFKRTQLLYFKKDSTSYIKNFLSNCAYPTKLELSKYLHHDTKEDLKKLLHYTWDEKNLKQLSANKTEIEVHLGQNDKILNSKKAYEFFKEFATVYYYKDKGHILQ